MMTFIVVLYFLHFTDMLVAYGMYSHIVIPEP